MGKSANRHIACTIEKLIGIYRYLGIFNQGNFVRITVSLREKGSGALTVGAGIFYGRSVDLQARGAGCRNNQDLVFFGRGSLEKWLTTPICDIY